MEAFLGNPMIGFSLLPVWVLVGLCQYLRRFTGKRHFQTWTSAWLFYALFLTLTLVPGGALDSGVLTIAKNWCVATGALLMLWGSFQFINVPTKQRLIAMMLVFNLMWSCAIADKSLGDLWQFFPSFAFLAVASGFTGYCIYRRRTGQAQRGTALLTLAFGLWALFLLCSPFLNSSEKVMNAGFMAASGLQLFIAISMMVLVLEETRARLQTAIENFAKEVDHSSKFRAEAEMAAESYRVLFENGRDAVAIVDEEELQIIELNAAARKLFGLGKTAPGVPLTCYCSMLNQKQTSTRLLSVALGKNAEVELTLHDGAKVRAKLRSQLIQYAGRRARQVIFTEVAERTNIGRQIRGGGKLSALGQVISGVAHELNNPLAAIKGYTDLLLLTSQLDPQTRSALLKVSQESNRAARLVRDLVAFARPEAPKIEPLNVVAVIQNFLEQRKTELEGKGIAVELELSPDTALALGSSEQMQQVLAHLLNNATEALEEVEGDKSILVSTANTESKIQIRVEDNGPGIDPDVLPRIFEPFFTTKPVGSGAGLGLSVCYSILLQHRGSIRCEPSALGGACFVVELPVAYSAIQQVSNIAAVEFRPKAAQARPAKILVVDDEPSVVALLNDMLTLLGHQVVPETSPYDALNRIDAEEFDAILSDFRMPGMTGGELFRRVTEAEPRYRSRFLFLTGDMMDPETHTFFKSTDVRCLLKPFQLSVLQGSLGEILTARPEEKAAAI